LANRRAMDKYDYPLFDDYLVSMKHGPVNSTVYNLINGVEEDREDWEEFVTSRQNYDIGLRRKTVTNKDLDELSNADLAVLLKTWDQFGKKTEWELVRYTHKYCPEWEDPGETAWSIPYARIFTALGKKHGDRLQKMIEERRQIESAFPG